MLKTLKDKWPLLALIGVSTFSVGMVVSLLKTTDAFGPNSAVITSQSGRAVEASPVLGLVKQSPEDRQVALSVIAQQDNETESDRARYLLGLDLLEQGNNEQAIATLAAIDDDYPLAAYAKIKQAQAQVADGDVDSAIANWNAILQTYPESTAAAEALYQLGERAGGLGSSEWNQLLQTFSSYPRSVQIAHKQLSQTAATDISTIPIAPAPVPVTSALDELSLLKLVARHGINQPNYLATLNRLTSKYSSVLTPEDWSAIGFGYWENQSYGSAGDAYAKATPTAVGMYRAARGKETAGKVKEAIATYGLLNQAFPDAPETATGLLNLSQLQDRMAAMKTLDIVIARFPDRAAEALTMRADDLDALKSPESAKQARLSVLSQYPDSEAAAKIRFKNARANVKAGNIASAAEWVQQIVEDSPDSELAPEAGFWLGKWSLRLNQPEVARRAFEQVIREHPESYFAWRSAVHLDWNVGDFDTVRSFMPQISLPNRRSPLPAGSPTLQELYLLGQDATAWSQWQFEFDQPQTPSVSEQFADGLLRLGVGDNLDGIFMVSSLAWRDLPEEKQEYALLKETPSYWQAIYPFPFASLILGWAQARSLNPLLVTALVRQESRFQADIESYVGAVGLMQVMPETADWISDQIGESRYTLSAPEDNVKFGTWYLDFTHREFANNSLFAVASYNAGPGSVDSWIEEGGFQDADEFVEKIPYPETKGYISSVFGGYWNYLRLYDPEITAKVADL
ncbi:MAG: transglycosylase SLT domain-containing protein [Phormidesmis sp.]